MKRAILAGLLLAAAPLTTLSGQNARTQDWGATFSETDGGHRLGNPDAATKLITFISYSCPHCANFELQSDAPLRLNYIQTGQASLEVRHVIRNPLDLAAVLTTECGPESKFWGNHRTMLRAQERWLQVAIEATPAQTQRWTTGTVGARMRAIASDLDFYELMEPRGYSSVQLDQCLTDEAAARAVAERARADNTRWEIPGTPSFAINGAMVAGVHDWANLQRSLTAAGQ
ncbi:hypothetical protein GCM10009127_15150 [Alteraurantiacibacter aestuarii]|uniref:Thioredoxin domain-containing protein n=1 Tax=Alteraurantiacibacter aestuarii TaxID=650004 RepID=A0A844ZJE5_9SPHN|nr:thioredoxin domain-containing protein [Alteraurantiacibacter aestuarii]MXO87898.1 thioredoxin domain-containing protein [Alteraurantiacibacter aestuarii]